MPNHEFETDNPVKDKQETQEPRKFCVTFHNDDFTPMDLVVQLLLTVFNKNPFDAIDLMMSVHGSGSANVGTYTREIAETKCAQATNDAREKGYPLKITIQPE